MPAPPQPESQDDILAADLASLTAADIPPDDECWALPDPDSGCPAEYADLTSAELDELSTAPAADPAGTIPREGAARRTGFGQDGLLDLMAPGPALAGHAADAHDQLADLSDDELIGVLRAGRRQTSWAQALELAAIGELARRRPAPHAPPAAPGGWPADVSEFTADEVALALTLTRAAAEGQLGLALALRRRPATAAALAAGRIDLYKATLICDITGLLGGEHAAAVEAAALPEAEGQTSGQLRAALRRHALRLDPAAMRRRKEQAQQDARVACWAGSGGHRVAGRPVAAAGRGARRRPAADPGGPVVEEADPRRLEAGRPRRQHPAARARHQSAAGPRLPRAAARPSPRHPARRPAPPSRPAAAGRRHRTRAGYARQRGAGRRSRGFSAGRRP